MRDRKIVFIDYREFNDQLYHFNSWPATIEEVLKWEYPFFAIFRMELLLPRKHLSRERCYSKRASSLYLVEQHFQIANFQFKCIPKDLIMRRKWNWMDHTQRWSEDGIAPTALETDVQEEPKNSGWNLPRTVYDGEMLWTVSTPSQIRKPMMIWSDSALGNLTMQPANFPSTNFWAKVGGVWHS